MAALHWMLTGNVTKSTFFASFVAAGVSSGMLLWVTRRTERRVTAKVCRIQRRMANLAGEVSALRDDVDSQPGH